MAYLVSTNTITRYFPNLLENETIPEADKAFIKNMLTKPWNLYILRHSALTEKSQILKEHVLRDHAGWTMSSKMPQVYIHYFGNESSKSLLEARGLVMHQLKYLEEIRPKDDLGNLQQVDSKELSLGKTLVENLTTEKFDLGQYSDSYAKELEKLIEAKSKCQKSYH